MLSKVYFQNLRQRKEILKSLDETDTANIDISDWYMGMLYHSHYFGVYLKITMIFFKAIANIQVRNEYVLDTSFYNRKWI